MPAFPTFVARKGKKCVAFVACILMDKCTMTETVLRVHAFFVLSTESTFIRKKLKLQNFVLCRYLLTQTVLLNILTKDMLPECTAQVAEHATTFEDDFLYQNVC